MVIKQGLQVPEKHCYLTIADYVGHLSLSIPSGCDFIPFIELGFPINISRRVLDLDGTSSLVEIVLRFPFGFGNAVREQAFFRVCLMILCT